MQIAPTLFHQPFSARSTLQVAPIERITPSPKTASETEERQANGRVQEGHVASVSVHGMPSGVSNSYPLSFQTPLESPRPVTSSHQTSIDTRLELDQQHSEMQAARHREPTSVDGMKDADSPPVRDMERELGIYHEVARAYLFGQPYRSALRAVV